MDTYYEFIFLKNTPSCLFFHIKQGGKKGGENLSYPFSQNLVGPNFKETNLVRTHFPLPCGRTDFFQQKNTGKNLNHYIIGFLRGVRIPEGKIGEP